MDYVIGIDCGGTKTRLVAYDLKGVPIGRRTLGPGNIMVDKEQTLATLVRGLEQLFEKVNGKCVYFLVGIAGISTSGYLPEVNKKLQQFGVPFSVVNDAVLGRMAGLKGRDGIYVICGTGSICYGRFDGVDYRVGGYGHLLGDEGSGYWLSILCYKHLTEQMDEGKTLAEMDTFTQKFLDYLAVDDPNEAVKRVYQKSKSEISEAALFLYSQGQVNDPVAQQIFEKGAAAISQQILQVLQRLPEQPSRIPLALAGGVVENNTHLAESIMEYLAPFGNFKLLVGKTEPTKAAYYSYVSL